MILMAGGGLGIKLLMGACGGRISGWIRRVGCLEVGGGFILGNCLCSLWLIVFIASLSFIIFKLIINNFYIKLNYSLFYM